MTFAELREEVKACGLDHLPNQRVNRLVNLAHRRVQNKELWPWRLAEVAGAPPFTVAQRGAIRQVLNSQGYEVQVTSAEELERLGVDPTTLGLAEFFYIATDGSVATYPVDSSVTVRHYARPSPLVNETDVPTIVDEEYHYLIVLDAVRRGKAENGEPEAAMQYANDFNELLADLKRDAFNYEVSGPTILNTLHEGE